MKFLLVLLVVLAATISAKTTSLTSARSRAVRPIDEDSNVVKGNFDAKIIAGATAVATPAPMFSPATVDKLKMAGLFVMWYGFNAGYNVYNAFVKKDFKYPWTTSTLQLMVGLVYAIPLWLFKVREIPRITKDDLMKLLPIAALNAFGHTAAVIAMFEKGGGSFTHVIKASEPVVSTILNLAINKVVPKPFTALSLLPITYGVAFASTLGDLSPSKMATQLTTKAAKMAMCSNIGFALRSIFRKNLPKDFKSRTGLDPANEHAVTTLLSTLMLIPLVLYFDSIPDMMSTISNMENQGAFWMNLTMCGMSFYLYNEMQNIVLGSLGAVPTAVGNTLKRVVIFAALYLFTQGETFPLAKVQGSAIAVVGCLAFAICNSKKI
jgi:solute carrier family 35 protein E1